MRLVVHETPVQNGDTFVNTIPEQESSIHEGHLGLSDGKERAVQEHDTGHEYLVRFASRATLAGRRHSSLTYMTGHAVSPVIGTSMMKAIPLFISAALSV